MITIIGTPGTMLAAAALTSQAALRDLSLDTVLANGFTRLQEATNFATAGADFAFNLGNYEVSGPGAMEALQRTTRGLSESSATLSKYAHRAIDRDTSFIEEVRAHLLRVPADLYPVVAQVTLRSGMAVYARATLSEQIPNLSSLAYLRAQGRPEITMVLDELCAKGYCPDSLPYDNVAEALEHFAYYSSAVTESQRNAAILALILGCGNTEQSESFLSALDSLVSARPKFFTETLIRAMWELRKKMEVIIEVAYPGRNVWGRLFDMVAALSCKSGVVIPSDVLRELTQIIQHSPKA